MIAPLSFTPAMRFNLLSKRSPNVPVIAANPDMIAAWVTSNALGKMRYQTNGNNGKYYTACRAFPCFFR